MRNKTFLLIIVVALVGAISLFLTREELTKGATPITENKFQLAAPQGFGDRHNGWAWSMQWWDGHLYVGTNHSFHCAEVAAFHNAFPLLFQYPPDDPDMECPEDMTDLDLRAEIWRWTPNTDDWKRVYHSPEDVPISGYPDKFVARDIGYRGMSVFQEPDGTEALYVAGVSSRFIWPGGPPPRILRSTDGVTFEPIPQEPGTFLGDYKGNGFRNQITYNGKFYINGGAIQGSGVLLESDNPAGGNDNFRVVSPEGTIASVAQSFNDYLYVGIRDLLNGYSIIKTDAAGDFPYAYKTIVDEGGYFQPQRNVNHEILSMEVFENRLYAGGNGIKFGPIGVAVPAELIRINPDDSWDVVVGDPRNTPDGPKYPLSGFNQGFGNFFNGHMWRLGIYADNLFVGTFDGSTTFKDDPELEPLLRHLMGFDLFRSPDGATFFPITIRGFEDKFNIGVRSMEYSPYGFFLGTANYYYGLQIWRVLPPNKIFMPIITNPNSQSLDAALPLYQTPTQILPTQFQLSNQVEAEMIRDAVIVSWKPIGNAHHYAIYRSELAPLAIFSEESNVSYWMPELLIGVTENSHYVDKTSQADKQYFYFVTAINESGESFSVSNLAPVPSAFPLVTFSLLNTEVASMYNQEYLTADGNWTILQAIGTVEALISSSDFDEAIQALADLRQKIESNTADWIVSWKAEDFLRILRKLERRVWLVQMDILQPDDVY